MHFLSDFSWFVVVFLLSIFNSPNSTLKPTREINWLKNLRKPNKNGFCNGIVILLQSTYHCRFSNVGDFLRNFDFRIVIQRVVVQESEFHKLCKTYFACDVRFMLTDKDLMVLNIEKTRTLFLGESLFSCNPWSSFDQGIFEHPFLTGSRF